MIQLVLNGSLAQHHSHDDRVIVTSCEDHFVRVSQTAKDAPVILQRPESCKVRFSEAVSSLRPFYVETPLALSFNDPTMIRKSSDITPAHKKILIDELRSMREVFKRLQNPTRSVSFSSVIDFSQEPHKHPYNVLNMVVNGTGTGWRNAQGDDTYANSGDWMFIPEGVLHFPKINESDEDRYTFVWLDR